jgi:RimJ/RimL family protein N-acetyltransferase
VDLLGATETDLAVIRPWFSDTETQRWLGGPDWPDIGLRLRGPARQSYVAVADNRPIGFIDFERYPGRRASFAMVIAPEARRLGFGQALLATLIAHPETSSIDEFFVGVETGNLASEGLVLKAGFVPVTEVDDDGFRYFAWWRHGASNRTWVKP